MELSGIAKYLEIYRERLLSADDERKLVVVVVRDVAGVSIVESDITIKQTVLHIKADSVTRHRLFVCRERIVKELASRTKQKITEVR